MRERDNGEEEKQHVLLRETPILPHIQDKGCLSMEATIITIRADVILDPTIICCFISCV